MWLHWQSACLQVQSPVSDSRAFHKLYIVCHSEQWDEILHHPWSILSREQESSLCPVYPRWMHYHPRGHLVAILFFRLITVSQCVFLSGSYFLVMIPKLYPCCQLRYTKEKYQSASFKKQIMMGRTNQTSKMGCWERPCSRNFHYSFDYSVSYSVVIANLCS